MADNANGGNTSNTDSCKTRYRLSEVNYTTATSGGIYSMNFDFQFNRNSDAPTNVRMVAQLTNCKGETMNIGIKLSYDAASGTYTGGQAISQDKDCHWTVTYTEVGAYNPCKELTWWGVTFDQSKANGTGTRNTAAATSSQSQQAQLL